MFYHAKNGTVSLGDTDMNYIAFGNGKKVLVMIPGLGDGLTTVKGLAIPFAWMYRTFAKKYRVYVFSRKNKLQEGCTTKDMARDLMEAMKQLGIKKAHIMGVSQGGMIAQHFALDYPEMVRRLVLCVTIGRQNPTIQRVVSYWHDMASKGKYKEIMRDTAEHMYVNYNSKQYNLLLPIMEKFCAPKSYERFMIQAKACLSHDAFDDLHKIRKKTLVIGGAKDLVLEGQSSVEIAEQIPKSRLMMYEAYGHGVYEEAKDFNNTVLEFLQG